MAPNPNALAARNAGLLDRISDKILRASAEACLGLVENVRVHRAQLEKSGNFTEIGRAAALKEALGKQYAPQLRKIQAPIAAAQAAVEQRRAALSLPIPDKTDLAGVLDRQEIRAHLRSLSLAQRTALVFESKDLRISDAVISAPPELSGIPADRFALLHRAALDRIHGPEMKSIAEAEAIVSEARAAIQVAKNDMRQETGLDEKIFGEVMGNVKQGAPWLVRQADIVLTVQPGKMVYQESTAEELATGKFYASMEDYKNDQAA